MSCRIQREMTGIENVNFSIRHVLAVALWLSQIKREVILTPDHQQARLFLAHPGLPLRVGIHIGSVVVEEIALDLSLVGLIKKVKLVSPEIGIVALDIRIISHVDAWAWSRETGDSSAARFHWPRSRSRMPGAVSNSVLGLRCVPPRLGR